MSKKFKLQSAAVMALVLLSACSAAGAAARNQPPAEAATYAAEPVNAQPARYSGVSCDIRVTRTAHGMSVQPIVSADRHFSGEYSLELTTSGGGNSSSINQGGPVSVDAGSRATLGENEVSLSRGAHLEAVLTVRDAHGELCRKTLAL
jgi:hypothetical protein